MYKIHIQDSLYHIFCRSMYKIHVQEALHVQDALCTIQVHGKANEYLRRSMYEIQIFNA